MNKGNEKVRILKSADLDLRESYNYYKKIHNRLAEQFLISAESAINKAANNPFHYQILKENYRQVLLSKFPFVVIFEVIDNTILIWRVFHTSRDPESKHQ